MVKFKAQIRKNGGGYYAHVPKAIVEGGNLDISKELTFEVSE